MNYYDACSTNGANTKLTFASLINILIFCLNNQRCDFFDKISKYRSTRNENALVCYFSLWQIPAPFPNVKQKRTTEEERGNHRLLLYIRVDIVSDLRQNTFWQLAISVLCGRIRRITRHYCALALLLAVCTRNRQSI